MNRVGIVAVGMVAGVAIYAAARRQASGELDFTALGQSGGFGDAVTGAFVRVSEDIGFMPFSAAITLTKNKPYVDHIRSVEQSLGLPRDMLLRVAYQESRFRPDIISGATVSSAGAKGMFQLMPVHWKEVDPLDWKAAARYAGKYLLSHYKRFGTWQAALAAYNWGQGNVAKYGIAKAPRETRLYYSQILADVGGGLVIA